MFLSLNSCCLCFKTSPPLLQLFRRMLQPCFAMKLEECFVDYKLHPTCHLHGGENIMTVLNKSLHLLPVMYTYDFAFTTIVNK